jgi:DNA modification methylase
MKTTGPAAGRLKRLLRQDLGFHDAARPDGRHGVHAFPAKFPPQLPRLFIENLTRPGETVLDPMMGSGTTVLEAVLAGRRGVGLDIDPMAVRLCGVKASSLEPAAARQAGEAVADAAEEALHRRRRQLERSLRRRLDGATLEFVEYWFAAETQLELLSLVQEIEKVSDRAVREFLALAFSAIIITKSGGVSLARDLAHTRPHRAEDKQPRPAIAEFRRRAERNARSLAGVLGRAPAFIQYGNAQAIPLADSSVDLLVTSPPYASNAIDYMRAHKFSLVWFGHPLGELTALRGRYIGGEITSRFQFAALPPRSARIVQRIGEADRKKGLALHRYYTEMTRMLSEAGRVLRPGKAAILVVGSSTMRSMDTETGTCLGEIGVSLGFELAGVATRALDRDRRMMPARRGGERGSQIEQRMYEEHVIALLKRSG